MTIQSTAIPWGRVVILAFLVGGWMPGDGRPQAPVPDGISRLMTAAGVPWLIRTSVPEGTPSSIALGGALGWGEDTAAREEGGDLCGLAVRPEAGCLEPISVYRPEGAAPVYWGARHRIVFPSMRAGDIEVAREVDVLHDSEICRWFDSFTNLGAEPRTFEVVLYHGFGAGDRPMIALSSAEGSVGPGLDDGVVLVRTGQGASGNGASGVLGHIVQGADSRAPLLRSDFGAGGPIYEPGLGPVAAVWVYRMTLAPGQRGVLLNAMAAGSEADAVRAELRRHLDGRLLILNGLTRPERGDIVNFNAALATTAWPQVEILSPIDNSNVPGTFPVRIHAADADNIVRLEVQGCSEVGRDDWDCRQIYTNLTQGASLDYAFSRSHCDYVYTESQLSLSADVWNAAGQTAHDGVMFWMWPPHDLRARFASPPDGARLGGQIQIAVEVRSEVAAVLEILVDGRVESTRAVGPDDNQIWRAISWVWDAGSVSDGMHRLDARISDQEGHTETACSMSVNVFNGIPPAVTISRPVDGAVVSGRVVVSAQARDNIRVVSLGLSIDGKAVADVQGSSDTLSAEVEWETVDGVVGTHEIKAVARDNDGLEGSRVIHVDVRNIGLIIKVSLGEERAWLIRKPYSLIRLAIDNAAGLAPVRYVLYRSADGAAYQSIQEVPAANISGNAHTFNDLTIQKGHTYSYRVEAYDAGGAKIGRSAEVTL